MAFTHKITRSWVDGAGRSLSGAVSQSNEAEDNRTLVVVDGATDTELLAIKAAGLKALYVLVTGRDDVTITFEKSGPATEKVLTLAVGVPYTWVADDDHGGNPAAANPFGNNIIDVKVVVASGAPPDDGDATVQIRVLQDS